MQQIIISKSMEQIGIRLRKRTTHPKERDNKIKRDECTTCI